VLDVGTDGIGTPLLVRASSEIGVSFPACRALRRRGGRRVCWGSRATVCGRLSWAGSTNDAVAAGDTDAAMSYRERTVDASEVFGPGDIRLTGYLRQGSCTLAERTRTHGLLAWRFRRRCWTRCSALNVLPAPAGQQRRNSLRVIVSPEPEGSVYGTPPLLIQLSMWPWTTCTLPGV
jgi:hypothetical protein